MRHLAFLELCGEEGKMCSGTKMKKIKENVLASVVMQIGKEPTLISSIFPLNADFLSVSSFISSRCLSPFKLLSQKYH